MSKGGRTLCVAPENRQGSVNEAYFSATQRKRGLGRSSLTLWETGVTKYIPDAAHLLGILETSLPQTNGLPLEPDDVSRCSREKKKFRSQITVGNMMSPL